MATVLFATGLSNGDTLAEMSRGIMRVFESLGHQALEIDFTRPGSVVDLEDLIKEKNIDVAVGICGYGYDAFCINEAGEQENIWSHYEIPFLSLHGDSPAYLFDRHVNLTPWHAVMYGFGDHYDFRLRLPEKKGIFGIMSPMVFDRVAPDEIDYKVKLKGKIIFPKNGGNPIELSNEWRRMLPKHVANHLFELADILVQNIQDEATCDIDALVADMFHAKGITIEYAAKTRLFYVAQLDDYLRRVKCTLIGEVLKEFPVEIHGKNWDFMDFSKAKCALVDDCDFLTTRKNIMGALAVLDFTPNTAKGFHDRFQRAAGLHTACLTNEQSAVTQIYGKNYGLTYKFNMDDLRNKLTVMLADPETVVEAGKQASQRFFEVFSHEAAVQSYLDAAYAVQLSATSGIEEFQLLQPYFIWPPKTLTN